VPQEAYLCDGGLFAEEVSYPSAVRGGFLGQSLHGEDIFERLGLGRVRERASHSQHNGSWERELTPGEKQRVALSFFSLTASCNQPTNIFIRSIDILQIMMARVLHQKPKYALVDEITSHVEEEIEAFFYTGNVRSWNK